MARLKTTTTQEVSKYKTAEAEGRAIMRRLRAYRTKLTKKLEGMTNQEKADYLNKLGEEAAARMGITLKPLKRVEA